MTDRAFRFGTVAVPQTPQRWSATARRAAELGYSTVLMPDGTQLPATLPSLAVAATAAPSLRVGSFVIAAPLHPAGLLAWEAHSLTVLTGGRFELGIGTGLPRYVAEGAELLAEKPLTGTGRLQRVRETVDRLRELDGAAHTPVMMAAGGPRALALAAEKADIVTVGAGALARREEVRGVTESLFRSAGPRAETIELSMNVFVVGDEVPPWIERFLGTDAASLREANSLGQLRGSTQDQIDELERRRELFGVSYLTVQGAFMEAFAPVVEKLTGK
jgi:alkanesulfonate monooxygenase SsuD/methylene tetrahydromethanopterin reductase-like flavin-dependent oxidoreductase (luciferase family)